MTYVPVVSKPRAWFEAKLKAGKTSLSAWTAWTGTKSRATQVTSTATAAQIGAALGALIDDLKARGVIN